MPSNGEIVGAVQEYCRKIIFDKRTEGNTYWDEYKQSWLDQTKEASGFVLKEEQLSRFTHQKIQEEVQRRFGTNDIHVEKQVGGTSNLAFDLWNRTEGTAYEISLGAVKNEFEKDVLKGLLDTDTTKLVILHREYKFGSKGMIFGRKWFTQPAQKEIIDRSSIFKFRIQSVPLVTDK